MKRVEMRVYGFVQGVGFRAYTKMNAMDLRLKGFAKNMPDGTVYIVAEGDEEDLKRLVEYVKNGPGRVNRVDYEFKEATGEFEGFYIL